MTDTLEAIATRFWSKVAVAGDDDCWLWMTGRNKKGYGRFFWNHHTVFAHRIAYKLANGTIPDGLCVCHRCDNPTCVNPAHLFLGTHLDNNRDREAKGRGKRAIRFGEQIAAHKLTDTQVTEIRHRYAAGDVMQKELAAEYGVCRPQISKIVRFIQRKETQE